MEPLSGPDSQGWLLALPAKYKPEVEMTDCVKHFSLLRYEINNERKKFYSKGFRMKKRTTLEAFEHTIHLFCYLLKRTSLKLESNNFDYLESDI